MADELVFYTNPMSRGRIVRWMLEEVGQPYRTEILDYGRHEGARVSGHQSDGQGPGDSPRRRGGDRMRRHLRLPGGRFPAGRACAAARDKSGRPTSAGCSSPPGRSRRRSPTRASASSSPPDKQRMVGYGSFDDVMNALETRFPRATTCWATSSARPTSISARRSAGACSSAGIEKRPAFERYSERLRSRPAAIRAAEIDDALIAGASRAGAGRLGSRLDQVPAVAVEVLEDRYGAVGLAARRLQEADAGRRHAGVVARRSRRSPGTGTPARRPDRRPARPAPDPPPWPAAAPRRRRRASRRPSACRRPGRCRAMSVEAELAHDRSRSPRRSRGPAGR